LKFGGGGVMIWSCLTWQGVNFDHFFIHLDLIF
jgi:hypothetical protein